LKLCFGVFQLPNVFGGGHWGLSETEKPAKIFTKTEKPEEKALKTEKTPRIMIKAANS